MTPPNTPLALGSIQMQPAGVYGGNDGSGFISLATGHVAPSGGAFVSLMNDNSSLVSMPAGVVIPAGLTNATFPVQTVTTGATVPVNVSAAYGGVTKTAILTVSAPSQNVPLSSVTLSPATVTGGSNIGVRVTVNLSAGAPTEGATVMLSSSNLKSFSNRRCHCERGRMKILLQSPLHSVNLARVGIQLLPDACKAHHNLTAPKGSLPRHRMACGLEEGEHASDHD